MMNIFNPFKVIFRLEPDAPAKPEKWILFTALFVMIFFTLPVFSLAADADLLGEYYEQARMFMEQGRYREAIQYYEKIVDIDPDSAPAYNGLGIAHLELGDPLADVIWFFKVAIDIDPAYIEPYVNMCRVYYQKNQYDNAESACLKVLELNPNLTAIQQTLAWVYLMGKSDPAKALRYFEEVQRSVNSPMVDFGMGMAYVELGDNARVLESITNLRSKGANELASQLEGSIRKNQAPPAAVQSELSSPVSSSSQVVASPKGHAATAPPSAQATVPVSGQMQIRLTGRLNNLEPPNQKKTQHPGSLSSSP